MNRSLAHFLKMKYGVAPETTASREVKAMISYMETEETTLCSEGQAR